MNQILFRRVCCLAWVGIASFFALDAGAGWEGEVKTVGKSIPAPGHTSRFEVEGSRMRLETTLPGMGPSLLLVDWKSGKAATILHANRMILEMDLKAAGAAAGVQAPYCDPSSGVDRCLKEQGFALKGTESVNGYGCDIYEKKSPEGVLTRIWRPKSVSDLSAVRVQVLAKDGQESMRSDYVNVKKKDFPASHFELPKGYIKQDMTSMMKAFMGGAPEGMKPKAVRKK
jgi:hypothetical protein